MEDAYHADDIEKKWQRRWAEQNVFSAENDRDRKAYIVEMLPYPSGRIHMGHVRNYSIGDAIARFTRMRGQNVLHPMGWDAFGMPAENAAIAHHRHPRDWTLQNIAQMRAQMQRLGFGYDWEREFATCDPEYYRHEQEMFLRMLEAGLAYRKNALANWCESCQTVLANEQVEDGLCWRCSSPVSQRELAQWFLRTTHYAQELLDGLDELAGRWPDKVLNAQRNWIGRSIGAEVKFKLQNPVDGITEVAVFTTRADTLYGVTFLSLAAEHPLALRLAQGTETAERVAAYVHKLQHEHKAQRSVDDTHKEGIFTGRYAVHPLSGDLIPIWIANFVLMDYGTGAVMAVPAHDQRDLDFARTYDLPIRQVIAPPAHARSDEAYTGPGIMINSAGFDGTPSETGKTRITELLEMRELGRSTVSYRLRDWLISRQRYWGTPIPVIHCDRDGVVPVPLGDLPVTLPLDVTITQQGGSPLALHPSFVQVQCPKCQQPARRETDTFDTFVESSWYLHRYTTPHYADGPVDPIIAKAWLPVDLYIGGDEHAVMHLMYARFWHRVMIDLGYLPASTPREFAKRLLTQGMVCHEVYFSNDTDVHRAKTYHYPSETELRDGVRVLKDDGRPVEVGPVIKMSKSKNNLIDPDELVAKYGADTARLFVLFAAPPEGQVDWNDAGVEGMHRFLKRIWRYVYTNHDNLMHSRSQEETTPAAAALRRIIHQTIMRVTHDIAERLQLNTAVAAQMEMLNALLAFKPQTDADWAVAQEGIDVLLRLLAPFAPHVAEELHAVLGGKNLIATRQWPVADEAALQQDHVEVPIQINGKVRARIRVAIGATENEVRAAALKEPRVAEHLHDKQILKALYVPGRILTLVVREAR
ncbi:MAG: leucine--tRNA ligase [Myxococcales bacterium]|nr:leucine--tRNA ligase [Myxococcales bacterium]